MTMPPNPTDIQLEERDPELEGINRKLKVLKAQFKLEVLQRITEATVRGDVESVGRWTNVLSTVRNLFGRLDD